MTKTALYILFFTIIQSSNDFAQPTWEKIKTPTDFNLLKVVYLDSLHCWAAGDSGVILFSSDQGSNWEMQNSGVLNYISDIFFLNDSLGWALTFEVEGINSDIRSKILITSNGGANWEINNYRHLNFILTTVFFLDSLNGWVGSKPSGISFSIDGGYNWSEANIDTGSFSYFPINEIKFSCSQYGFAVGGAVDVAGVVWKSSNNGELWKAYGVAPDKFDDFIFLDSINTLSLSADQERLYPIGVLNFDIQQNFWSYTELNAYGKVTSLSKRTASEIWGTLGCDTSFIVSFDGTKSWQFIPTNDQLCINSIAFADSLHGIAVGDSGYIFRYVPDNPVSVDNIEFKIFDRFLLEQNYPNPFNPSTKISWQSPESGWQTLKIYDILGNEIVTLVDEYRPSGAYEVEFSVGQNSSPGIASGMYFYRLQVGEYVATKKMLLLK